MRPTFFLVLMVLLAAATDLHARRIPNALVASGIVAALMLHTVLPHGAGWQFWLLGLMVGFALFFPFYLLHGMGAGDVKLMAAVGAFAGPALALKIALATFLIGGVWSLIVIICKGKFGETWTNLRALAAPVLLRRGASQVGPANSVGRLPYGVAIALGTIVMLTMGAP